MQKCLKPAFSLLTTRGPLLWLYRSICFVLNLHSLYRTPGGDSSLWLFCHIHQERVGIKSLEKSFIPALNIVKWDFMVSNLWLRDGTVSQSLFQQQQKQQQQRQQQQYSWAYRRDVDTGSCGSWSSPPWCSWVWSSDRRAAPGGWWREASAGCDPAARTFQRHGTVQFWGGGETRKTIADIHIRYIYDTYTYRSQVSMSARTNSMLHVLKLHSLSWPPGVSREIACIIILYYIFIDIHVIYIYTYTFL